MGKYMPEFKNENEYNKWMEEESKKIPRDTLGIPTFKDMNHFTDTLKNLGMENISVSGNVIRGIIK